MSNINKTAAQTFCKLFRPWDCDSHESAKLISFTKNISADATAVTKLETERDHECASSSTKSSNLDYGFNNDMQMEWSSSASTSTVNNLVHTDRYYTNSLFYGSMENQLPYFVRHHPHREMSTGMTYMMPSMPAALTNDLYYAAAATAATGIPTVSTNSFYGLVPYSLSIMEQEYARMMAEDAQLKVINARKQRPKKFKCPHCDVAFSNNGQLKGHIRIHTGERPFKCDVGTCRSTFARNEELTRHKRTHSGLRPYPCTACGKKFGRRDHLKKHMKTHMPQEQQLNFCFPFLVAR